MSLEKWDWPLILSLLANASVAVWALVVKLIPVWQQAKIAGNRDEQEHRQKLEERERTYNLLQDSWQEDKLATLLEEDHTFIRDTVHGQLLQALQAISRVEYTLAQTRDALAILAAESSRDRERKNEDVKKQNDNLDQTTIGRP